LQRVVGLIGTNKNDIQAMRQADVSYTYLNQNKVDSSTDFNFDVGKDNIKIERHYDEKAKQKNIKNASKNQIEPNIVETPKMVQDLATVLLEENTLMSIVNAILTSRENIDNCRKAIGYTTMKLLPELMMSTLFQNMLNIPSPTTTMILFWIDSFIDLLPTLSFVFEPLEDEQRRAPPRNLSKERIVGWRTVLLSYLFIGIIQTGGCFSTYLMMFKFHGITFNQLFLQAHLYFGIDAVHDDGQLIPSKLFLGRTLAERTLIWHRAKAAVLICFGVQQTLPAFSRRFRTASMFNKGFIGIFDNWRLTISVAISLGVLALAVYFNPFAIFLSIQPPHGHLQNLWCWFFPLCSVFVQILFSEWRKYQIRKHGSDSIWHKLFDY